MKKGPRSSHPLVQSKGILPRGDPLSSYLRQINRYPLLSEEQEKKLLLLLEETGDIEVAKKLVLHNLRLVVKIAMGYKSTWQNIMDLIQEGNIGLMKAISKYDSSKGSKLSSYASWWIKSYILKFILDNFKMVKIGTTNEKKKLFFNLMREKSRLEVQGLKADPKLLSHNLAVSEKAVQVMEQRLSPSSSDLSLEAPLKTEGKEQTLLDLLPGDAPPIEDVLSHRQGLDILKKHLKKFVAKLSPRDQDIFEKRLLQETPSTLQTIAEQYGVSRERVRQIEAKLMENLKLYMKNYLR